MQQDGHQTCIVFHSSSFQSLVFYLRNNFRQQSNMKLQWVHILTLAQDWLAFSKVHFAPLLPAHFWFEIRLLKQNRGGLVTPPRFYFRFESEIERRGSGCYFAPGSISDSTLKPSDPLRSISNSNLKQNRGGSRNPPPFYFRWPSLWGMLESLRDAPLHVGERRPVCMHCLLSK